MPQNANENDFINGLSLRRFGFISHGQFEMTLYNKLTLSHLAASATRHILWATKKKTKIEMMERKKQIFLFQKCIMKMT